MDLYYNCSYDNSPVGFCIGKISNINLGDLQPENSLELSGENVDPFIRKCFESGVIRTAYGKMPSELSQYKDNYFILKKKMIQKEENGNYYMSIALAGLTWDQFSVLMKYEMKDTNKVLADLVRKSIRQDKNSAFGYHVCEDGIEDLLNFKYANVCNCKEERVQHIQSTDCFYAKLVSANVDRTVIRQIFGESLRISSVSQNYVCFKKKLKIRMKSIIIWAMAVMVMLVIVLSVIWK